MKTRVNENLKIVDGTMIILFETGPGILSHYNGKVVEARDIDSIICAKYRDCSSCKISGTICINGYFEYDQLIDLIPL